MGDKLQLMGLTVLMGLLIVFSVLIILWVAIEVMHFFVTLPEKRKAKKDAQQPAPQETKPVAAETADDEDEDELVAVLTAAIAASQSISTYNLKIKSFKRIKNTSWKSEY